MNPFRLYAELILGALLLGALGVYAWLLHSANSDLTHLRAGESSHAALNQVQLTAAHDEAVTELVLVHRTLAVPHDPVRLCHDTPVRSGETAHTGTGAGPAAVSGVLAGDPGLRPEDHPDIRPLLDLLAYQGARIAIDLREQQGVK